MKVRFENASLNHARLIASDMRAKDVEELEAGWGLSPMQAMTEALEAAYCAKVLLAGFEPLCIVGLAPLTVIGNTARCFMFASAAIDRHPFAFARATRKHVGEFFSSCRLATNFVEANDEPVLKWLKWIGFEQVPGIAMRGGRPFIQVIIDHEQRGRLCQRA